MNPVLETIYSRKSVRAYLDKEISEEDKRLILEAAVNAPTAGNMQLYSILDISDQKIKDALAVSCDNQPFIKEGKLVLVFLVDCRKWYAAFKEAGAEPSAPSYGDFILATEDAMAAAENAVLAAESLGIGSCYIGDILEKYEYHRELFKLPDYVYPYSMLVFGYPTEQQKARTKPKRVPLKHIVFENSYREMDGAELREMFAEKTENRGFDEWMRAFCARKYDSDFSVEMDRSAGEMIKTLQRK